MMRDLFLPKISATEFDTNPDAMKEINHDSSAKINVQSLYYEIPHYAVKY